MSGWHPYQKQVYLIFNRGYSATAGEHWTRLRLCDEAVRLGRILVALMREPEAHGLLALMPREPEAHGLLALMQLQASRLRGREKGRQPVLLRDQDRALWDRSLIRRPHLTQI